ncbi:hypothetical protein [Nocardia sp. NPDC006630]|uniref:hypothetical protein n=1 Tax=Nocardia sp. NPDC006630 TaxID=3157181 RepID=UPI00339DFE8E
MSVRGRERRWAGLVPAGYSLVLALLVLGPLLGPGYLLLRDAVSTPRSYLTDSALGLGDAAPRAVPQDALIAILSPFIDGGLIVKVILLAALWLAGWGAATLARDLLRVSTAPQLVAATLAIWNPYVAERLLQGHWSLLTGYAALPWIALLANRLRAAAVVPAAVGAAIDAAMPADPPVVVAGAARLCGLSSRRCITWAALGGWLAAAGLTPTGSLLAGCVAFLLVGRRNLAGAVGLWIVAAAPWLAATALAVTGAEPSDPAGVAAFAARAEPWLGTLGSVAGLGGIWNSTAVPDSRTTFFALIGTVLLLGLVATGVHAVIGRRPLSAGAKARISQSGNGGSHTGTFGSGAEVSTGEYSSEAAGPHTCRVLIALAVAAVVLPALGATGWGLSAGEFLVTKVPGAGLLRDTQKFVALAMPGFALCAAAGCRAVSERISAGRADTSDPIAEHSAMAHGAITEDSAVTRGRDAGARIGGVAAVFIVLMLVALPDLAWGVGGALRPVQYPGGWERVAGMVEAPGDVAVLPGGMFRKFRYSGSAPVLDPAPRLLPRDVLQTGELPVRGATVSGEGVRAHTVEQLLLRGGSARELADLGVGWVLVEHRTPGPLGESKTTLAELNSVYSDADLQLYRVPGSIADHDASASSRRIAGAAHLLWAALLCGGILSAAAHMVSLSGIPQRIRRESRPR